MASAPEAVVAAAPHWTDAEKQTKVDKQNAGNKLSSPMTGNHSEAKYQVATK